MLSRVGVVKRAKALPSSVDLRQWFSPVEDQGTLGACTAQAGVGMIEYFEKRAFGKHIDASRLFLYKVTRNMLHWTGDTPGPSSERRWARLCSSACRQRNTGGTRSRIP
jgi:C1A family cysteine protease